MSSDIVFVLVGTSHTGNVGAAARAIKNMGFSELRLVDCCSHLTKEALSRSSGADAVLQNATKFESLDAAVADCQNVIGSSARDRYIAVPVLSCREIAQGVAEEHQTSATPKRTALVFGRERTGLSNEEVDRCTRILRIPCNPDFSSLNLGAAVQVVAYEVAVALDSVSLNQLEKDEEETVDSSAMQHFYDHLQRVMIATGFLDAENPRHLMRRIRRYFEKNRPNQTELNILRGILTSTEKPHPPKETLK